MAAGGEGSWVIYYFSGVPFGAAGRSLFSPAWISPQRVIYASRA